MRRASAATCASTTGRSAASASPASIWRARLGAGLGEHRDRVAALGDLDLVDAAAGGGGGGEDAEDVELLDLVVALLQLLVPGPPVAASMVGTIRPRMFTGRPSCAAIVGQPGLLQPPQRHRRGGVAGQDHEVAALVEQPLAAGAGQLDDLLAGAPAIGACWPGRRGR